MQLHELLAVESNLQNQARKVTTELSDTFRTKRHLFEKKIVTFTPNTEGSTSTIESQSDIQTTVKSELAWIKPMLVKHINAEYQIADANTKAKADIIIENDNGEANVIARQVTGTALLELEKRLAEIHTFVSCIPTLDPAKGFSLDPNEKNTYIARSVNKTRTRKEKKVIVKYEATDKHPAQVELIDVDSVIGSVSEQEWSGLITPADKADIISRVEILQRAVKAARSRANNQEIDTTKAIGGSLLNFIFENKI